MTTHRTDTEEKLLSAILNVIIPPSEKMPGAGSPAILEECQRMADGHERFGEAVSAILLALGDEFPEASTVQQTEALRELEITRPDQFELFVEVAYLAYYSDSDVHRHIGWRTGALQPLGWELPPFREDVLDTVKQREPFWRDAD
jgi:hypothetical protein